MADHIYVGLDFMDMRSLINRNSSDIALIIGNGINRYDSSSTSNSWEALLRKLARKYHTGAGNIPAGISLTEFYDVLELKSGSKISGLSLQKDFCEIMAGWKPWDHHRHIAKWAKDARAPILTTNFENALGNAVECELLRTTAKGFTDYYPWTSYYGDNNNPLTNPCDGFGIWHINGMEHYHRSIRLGLSHYMGSVGRARAWLHRGKDRRLFSGKSTDNWAGKNTWVHIIFNSPLLIFGLALEENEVFFRWLLIERARYFKKFPYRSKKAWYVHTNEKDGSGKLFFLKGVGVQPVKVNSYDDIYSAQIWD